MQYNQTSSSECHFQNRIIVRIFDHKIKVINTQRNWLTILLTSTTFLYSCSTRLSSGIYKGTEKITVAPDNTLWPGIITGWTEIQDPLNRQWFHQVIITFKGRTATITKEPFYVKDGTVHFSDAIGGFYYYKGDVEYEKTDKTFNISCSLSSCKYCPKSATATPLYTYESYEIRRQKRNLLINTNYQKGLLFKRQ